MMAKIKVRFYSGDNKFLDKILAQGDIIEVPAHYSIGEILRIGRCLLECVEIVEP